MTYIRHSCRRDGLAMIATNAMNVLSVMNVMSAMNATSRLRADPEANVALAVCEVSLSSAVSWGS